MKNLQLNGKLNQNLIVWICALVALFVCELYNITGAFWWFSFIIGLATTVSLLVCLFAYTRNYQRQKCKKNT